MTGKTSQSWINKLGVMPHAILNMRVLTILFTFALALAGCSKPAAKVPSDFTPYLHLQPGTRIKVTPLIETKGYAPKVVRDAIGQAEQDMIVTGTVISITKDQLSIRPDNPKQPVGFIPAGVKSIEVLEPLK